MDFIDLKLKEITFRAYANPEKSAKRIPKILRVLLSNAIRE
ncbi:hypothetical protein [Clostridium butyricum]